MFIKEFLGLSMQHHMDLIETFKEYEWFIPAGCLFVLKVDANEYQKAKNQLHIQNVSFRKKPKQLHSIITTPENIGRVQWWMQKNGFSTDKVYDFEGFQKKMEEDNLYSLLMNSTLQQQKK